MLKQKLKQKENKEGLEKNTIDKMTYKSILGTVPTFMSIGTMSMAAKPLKKKKISSKSLLKAGVGSILGTSLTSSVANTIKSL